MLSKSDTPKNCPVLTGSLSFSFCSYAREWQAKLRELQETTAATNNSNKSKALALPFRRRSPSKDLPPSIATSLPLPLALPPPPAPIVSITPTKKASPPRGRGGNNNKDSPIKMDSNGALNLAASPSPPPPDTSNSPSRNTPPGPRPHQSFGVEMCVVCGDRASGKSLMKLYHRETTKRDSFFWSKSKGVIGMKNIPTRGRVPLPLNYETLIAKPPPTSISSKLSYLIP